MSSVATAAARPLKATRSPSGGGGEGVQEEKRDINPIASMLLGVQSYRSRKVKGQLQKGHLFRWYESFCERTKTQVALPPAMVGGYELVDRSQTITNTTPFRLVEAKDTIIYVLNNKKKATVTVFGPSYDPEKDKSPHLDEFLSYVPEGCTPSIRVVERDRDVLKNVERLHGSSDLMTFDNRDVAIVRHTNPEKSDLLIAGMVLPYPLADMPEMDDRVRFSKFVFSQLSVGGTLLTYDSFPEFLTLANTELDSMRPDLEKAKGPLTVPEQQKYLNFLATRKSLYQANLEQGLERVMPGFSDEFDVHVTLPYEGLYAVEGEGEGEGVKIYSSKKQDQNPIELIQSAIEHYSSSIFSGEKAQSLQQLKSALYEDLRTILSARQGVLLDIRTQQLDEGAVNQTLALNPVYTSVRFVKKPYRVNQQLIMSGLKNKSLNGQTVTFLRNHKSNPDLCIVKYNDKKMSINKRNVSSLFFRDLEEIKQFTAGDLVELHGLRAKGFNGLKGELRSYNFYEGRFAVAVTRDGNSKIMSIKAENLKHATKK